MIPDYPTREAGPDRRERVLGAPASEPASDKADISGGDNAHTPAS